MTMGDSRRSSSTKVTAAIATTTTTMTTTAAINGGYFQETSADSLRLRYYMNLNIIPKPSRSEQVMIAQQKNIPSWSTPSTATSTTSTTSTASTAIVTSTSPLSSSSSLCSSPSLSIPNNFNNNISRHAEISSRERKRSPSNSYHRLNENDLTQNGIRVNSEDDNLKERNHEQKYSPIFQKDFREGPFTTKSPLLSATNTDNWNSNLQNNNNNNNIHTRNSNGFKFEPTRILSNNNNNNNNNNINTNSNNDYNLSSPHYTGHNINDINNTNTISTHLTSPHSISASRSYVENQLHLPLPDENEHDEDNQVETLDDFNEYDNFSEKEKNKNQGSNTAFKRDRSISDGELVFCDSKGSVSPAPSYCSSYTTPTKESSNVNIGVPKPFSLQPSRSIANNTANLARRSQIIENPRGMLMRSPEGRSRKISDSYTRVGLGVGPKLGRPETTPKNNINGKISKRPRTSTIDNEEILSTVSMSPQQQQHGNEKVAKKRPHKDNERLRSFLRKTENDHRNSEKSKQKKTKRQPPLRLHRSCHSDTTSLTSICKTIQNEKKNGRYRGKENQIRDNEDEIFSVSSSREIKKHCSSMSRPSRPLFKLSLIDSNTQPVDINDIDMDLDMELDVKIEMEPEEEIPSMIPKFKSSQSMDVNHMKEKQSSNRTGGRLAALLARQEQQKTCDTKRHSEKKKEMQERGLSGISEKMGVRRVSQITNNTNNTNNTNTNTNTNTSKTNERWGLTQSSTSPTPSQDKVGPLNVRMAKPGQQVHLSDYYQSLLTSQTPKITSTSSNTRRSSAIAIPLQNKQRYDFDFKASLQQPNFLDKRLEIQPAHIEEDESFEMEI